MTNYKNLTSIRERFHTGKATKQQYINDSLEIHRILHSYIDIIQRSEINEISISADGVRFIIGAENIIMFAPPDEGRVAPIEIMNFGDYEPKESEIIDLLSARTSQFLDIGANIGWHSIRLAKRNRRATIHAFEPIPTSFSYLQRNILCNNLSSRVIPYNCGLSEACGTTEFFVAPHEGTNASMRNVADAHKANRIRSDIITLDQWCYKQNVKPDFIKCDVEGAELLVFRGGLGTIKSVQPVVFTELLRKWTRPFGYHPNEVISLFSGMGYLCFAVNSKGVKSVEKVTEETSETNFAFLHADKHQQEIEEIQKQIPL